MNRINFEGIGLSFNINEIAFEVAGNKIYWYAIFIVMAMILGIILCKKDDGKYNINFSNILELLLFMIPISIICARIYFVIFKLDYYRQNLSEIFNIENGGLAIYGGLIGAFLTIILYCKKKKINILDMCDYIVPFVPLGQAIGRWGNFFNSEAYGVQTNSLLRMGIIENGKYIEVHPTFLYESLATFIIFIFLFKKRNKRKYKGELLIWYLFLYGAIRIFIEALRTDSLMLLGIRVSQVLSFLLCLICGSIIIYKKVKSKDE